MQRSLLAEVSLACMLLQFVLKVRMQFDLKLRASSTQDTRGREQDKGEQGLDSIEKKGI